MRPNLREKHLKVLTRELPFERPGSGAVVILKAQQVILQLRQRRPLGSARLSVYGNEASPNGLYILPRMYGLPCDLSLTDASLFGVERQLCQLDR